MGPTPGGKTVSKAAAGLACGVCAAGLLLASPANASSKIRALDTARHFDIASQPLELALLEFARQSGLQVISAGTVLRGKTAHAVRGPLPAGRALSAMLAGTSLSFYSVGDTTVTIVPGRAGASRPFTIARALADAPEDAPIPPAPPVVFEEVIVTATRVETNVVRVPISIAAFTGPRIDQQGIRAVDDLTRMTPGVNFSRTSNLAGSVSIRGISSPVGSGTTGIYLDDTPIQNRAVGSNPRNVFPNVFDLERVEILRGPQGTLFGAGAEGGAIRFITNKANVETYSANGRAEVAFTANGAPSWEMGVAVGGPIIREKLGFRVGAYHRRDGGFVDRKRYIAPRDPTRTVDERDANDLDTTNLRASLAWRPTDKLIVTPSIDVARMFSHDILSSWMKISDIGGRNYRTGNGQPTTNLEKYALTALSIEADLGWAKLTSTTSNFFRRETGYYDYVVYMGGNFTPDGNLDPWMANPEYFSDNYSGNKNNIYTQEIRLASVNPEARLNWVVGAYAGRIRQSSQQRVRDIFLDDYVGAKSIEAVYGYPYLPGGIAYAENINTHEDQEALFGEMSFDVTRRLRLTGGLRYSIARFDFTGHANGPMASGPVGLRSGGKSRERPVTPKFGVQFNFDDDNMIYATAAKGFRIGGANRLIPRDPRCDAVFAALGLLAAPVDYDSDSLWSYEIGTKNKLLDGRLRWAGAAYYIEWKNIIRNVAGRSGCPYSLIANLGDATSKGFDFQADWMATDALQINLAVGYNLAETTTTLRVPGAVQDLATKGHTLGGSPWTINLAATYEFEAPAIGLPAYLRADFTYRSVNTGLRPESDPTYPRSYDPLGTFGDPTHELRVRAGVRHGSGLNVSLFVNNLLNDNPVNYARTNNRTNIFVFTPSRPRTVGLTAIYRY
jgi:iron complex outermembrane receptor protein